MPARHHRHNRARSKRFRYDLALDLRAPATPSSHPGSDLDGIGQLRKVRNMLDHVCEPICARWLACCSSAQMVTRWGQNAAYAISAVRRSLRSPHHLLYARSASHPNCCSRALCRRTIIGLHHGSTRGSRLVAIAMSLVGQKGRLWPFGWWRSRCTPSFGNTPSGPGLTLRANNGSGLRSDRMTEC